MGRLQKGAKNPIPGAPLAEQYARLPVPVGKLAGAPGTWDKPGVEWPWAVKRGANPGAPATWANPKLWGRRVQAAAKTIVVQAGAILLKLLVPVEVDDQESGELAL